jgi:hypothetical protein
MTTLSQWRRDVGFSLLPGDSRFQGSSLPNVVYVSKNRTEKPRFSGGLHVGDSLMGIWEILDLYTVVLQAQENRRQGMP